MDIGAQVEIASVERLTVERSRWSDRHVFGFAVRTGKRTLVDFIAPDFALVDQEAGRGSLFCIANDADRATSIGLATFAMASERDRHSADSPVDRALAKAAFFEKINRSASLRPAGEAWQDGLDALRHALGELVGMGCGEPVFAFSRVYPWPTRATSHSLIQNRTGSDGQILARYRIQITLRPYLIESIQDGATPIGSDSGMI